MDKKDELKDEKGTEGETDEGEVEDKAPTPITVRVIPGMVGYYDNKRRRGGEDVGEGEVFVIKEGMKLFSKNWMELVDDGTEQAEVKVEEPREPVALSNVGKKSGDKAKK